MTYGQLMQLVLPADKEPHRVDEAWFREQSEALVSERVAMLRHKQYPRLTQYFDVAEADCLSRFLSNLDTVAFAKAAVEQLGNGRGFVMPDPLGGGQARFAGSLYTRRSLNFCRFLGGAQEFYVIQHVSSIDALYFPKAGVLIPFKHVALFHLADFFAALVSRRGDIDKYLARGSFGFEGWLASHGRPYHFFYDVAPGFVLMRGAVNGKQELYYTAGGKFISIARVLSLPVKERVLPTPPRVLAETLKKGMHRFLLGVRFGDKMHHLIQDLDAAILECSPRLVDGDFKDQVSDFCAQGPVVWMGITGQKRAWTNQVEGLTAVVERLVKRFGTARVVIDGWTSSLESVPRDRAEVEADSAVVEEIRQLLPPDVQSISSVGMTAAQKIYLAQRIDFFVANHSTGSMYVSRFAGRPGVSHSSTVMPLDDHIHQQVVKVDPAAVTDVNAGKVRADFVSYHMDVAALLKAVDTVLEMVPHQRFTAKTA